MLLLSKSDIQACYSLTDCIKAVEDAFKLFSTDKVEVPLRTQIKNHANSGSYLCMPALCESYNASCVKVLNVFPENINRGESSINAQVLNIDTESGAINAILDGNYLTQLRTGAASGVAIEKLAKSQCHKGALIGTGGQAATQLEAMLISRHLDEVQVSDLDYSRAKEFAAEMTEKLASYKTTITAVPTANMAITDADIIISVTPSKRPVYDGTLVKQGATICGVGSYQPQMQETPSELVQRADKIYFDSQDAVLSEAGDILIPLRKKEITQSKFTGELGKVISGELAGRQSDSEIIFFETVGIAAQDLITAKSIYDKAVQKKVGTNWAN